MGMSQVDPRYHNAVHFQHGKSQTRGIIETPVPFNVGLTYVYLPV